MKKRHTLLGLLMLLTACVFAGCNTSGGTNSSIASSDTQSSTAASSSSVAQDVTYEINVCFDDNTPAGECDVTVTLNGETKANGKTNTQGKFTFTLAPAEYTVTVTPPQGYAADPVTTDVEGTAKTVKLLQTGAFGDQIAYTFTVTNDGGIPMEDITVKLVEDDGTTVIKSAQTNEDGLVLFYMDPASYNVTLDGLPNGYTADEQYKQTDNLGTNVCFVLTPGLLQGQSMPANTVYDLGSVMYDFSAPLSDGSTWSLYDALETKKMVLINFWATWCGPCASEFPAMDAAFGAYEDSVDVVCLSTDSADTVSVIQAYKQQREIDNLLMGSDSGNLYGRIRGLDGAVPVTLIIDRNGVLCQVHVGAQVDVEFFTGLFDKYIRDDYTTDVGVNRGNGGGSGDGGDQFYERELPNVEMTPTADIEALINNTDSGYTFSYSNYPGDEYSWPWVIQDVDLGDGEGTQTLFGPSNSKKGYSYSILCSTFEATAGQVLAFDYWMQMEAGYDEVYIQIDGVIQHILSEDRVHPQWKTCYAYVVPKTGTYEMTILFNKDEQYNFGLDNIFIRNMRFLSANEVETDLYVKRYAATEKNPDAPDFESEDRGSVAQYNSYVEVVYNADDGYYHVGNVNGPLLLADLMYSTPWSNQYTIWNLAFADYFIVDGVNLKSSIEQYAWQQNNSDVDVLATPVNVSLYYLIRKSMAHLGFTYDNAWLEVCFYYDYYGPKGETHQKPNPVAGIDFISAIDVEYEPGSMSEAGDKTTFTAEIRRQIVPRGYKFAFIPEVDGVYQIESLSTGVDAAQDTMVWLFDQNQTMIAQNDGAEFTNGYNFGLRIRLEAGRIYYIACCYFAVGGLGSFDVQIMYLGETFTEWQVGAFTYSYQEDTSAEYLSDAVEYMLDTDGYYYVKNADGTKGSALYINMFAPSKFSPMPTTLRDYINWYAERTDANGNPKINPNTNAPYYNTTDQGFNFKHMTNKDGSTCPDYLDEVKGYLAQAEAVDENDKYYGYIRANEEIADILRLMFNNSRGSDLDNHWLLLAFYEKAL